MKNKIKYLLLSIFILSLNISTLLSDEMFNFNVSDIEITQNGNIFKGFNGGEAFTNNGVSIKANKFEYNKKTSLLISNGDVELKDKLKNITIEADEISYLKNEELIIASGNVKMQDYIKKLSIYADKITFKKNEEIITANSNVHLEDKKNNIIFRTKKITYFRNKEEIYTIGESSANIQSKYEFVSEDLFFQKNKMKLSSNKKSFITDDQFSLYKLGSFVYQIDDKFLKGTDVTFTSNTNLPIGESDQLFFKNGFFDLKNKNFDTAEIKIKLKKNSFDRSENDPRIYGASSSKNGEITSIKKAVFTSCKQTDKCPPWQLEASEIKHDKNKKQLIYDNTILKIYDVPVFYFPKFFHPDPTVKRQSGFLPPKFNNSNVLGSSLSLPYFYAISENKDLTISPTFFSKTTKLIQSEYRQKNQNSSFIADFGFTRSYNSPSSSKKKNINHLFAKLEKNLKLDNFVNSNFNIFYEKVTKDTYLKIFDDNLSISPIKPKNLDNLNSGFNLLLENENSSFYGGAEVFEDLSKGQSDRYQFVFPYYNFSKNLNPTNYGNFEFSSQGDNILENTNILKSKIINDFNFKSNDKIINHLGLKNNINVFLKNLNNIGKNADGYKSSPQSDLQTLFEINSELPLLKISDRYNETLIPKISFKINPGEMKNHSADERDINVTNIFNANRLGIDDSLEAGNSLTFGIDYKKENKIESKNFVQFKLASVLRDSEEENISKQTSLNKKNSNLFGSIDVGLSEHIELGYKFAMDNKIEEFKYNSIGVNLSLNNFVTTFNFVEDNASRNNANYFENTSKYKLDQSNSLEFKTRRNREISLTEYYDLVYEYNNDCMTAGIKYNKTYYEDRDLKPTENLMFTISLFPLTSIQQSSATE